MRLPATIACAAALLGGAAPAAAQSSADGAAARPAATLRAVVVVSRHGVRSPTNPTELLAYTAHPWPAWEVDPGFLTPHGATLMTAFGAAYRRMYAAQGLLAAAGCPVPGAVYVWADVDERTKATARALLDGFAPGCGLVARDLGAANDPLFHSIPAAGTADSSLALAALAGSLGDDPGAVVASYGLEFRTLDDIMGCGSSACIRASSVNVTIKPSPKSGFASLDGAIDIASTAVEDLILAYTDGKDMAQFGAPGLDARTLLELSRLHTLKSELTTQTPYVSRVQGSNLLAHLSATIDELATGKQSEHTRVPASAHFVALIGHDTNLETLAGILRLRWLMRGYQINDTPPGGALAFEVYAATGEKPAFVRTYFTAQSLDEMRSLSTAPPARVPVFIPGCPSLDCPIPSFDHVVASAIDPAYVIPW